MERRTAVMPRGRLRFAMRSTPLDGSSIGRGSRVARRGSLDLDGGCPRGWVRRLSGCFRVSWLDKGWHCCMLLAIDGEPDRRRGMEHRTKCGARGGGSVGETSMAGGWSRRMTEGADE